ncbi:MAG: Fur family transcriptional regulator, peroxide stress response regulator [Synergistales bacterium]|nr:Fur family transcriptional regulator, peroxide stress response regulator [Synergistales bacterium]
MWTVEEARERLKSYGAKVTIQRLGILKLLENRKDHPPAERIYNEMREAFPTISFATIYSTAQLLQDAGLIQIITIDGKRVFFDPNPEVHGHFRCEGCGEVFDFPIEEKIVDKLKSCTIHNVSRVQFYLYGLCSQCARKVEAGPDRD